MSPSSRRIRSLILSAAGVTAACAVVAAPAVAASPAKVHFRGTAYEFNNVKTMLAGGVVKVAEYPALSAKIASDGSYDIALPNKKKVTLYAVADGYHSIYTQTFTTDGENLENVNLQTPTDAVYSALVTLLSVPVGADGNPVQCAIVSTFSTKNVRALDYQGFIGYGAHGVAGATASGTPALPPATYFNEHVVPDPKQEKSSKDGGVVWTGVPSGTYTIKASHPTAKFAPFDATCVPGRVVNANPPQGLHELAANNPAKVAATWKRTAKGQVLQSLRLTKVPAKSTVVVECAADGCPLNPVTPKAGTVTLRPKAAGRPIVLRKGQDLEVWVSSPVLNGTLARWVAPKSGAPKASTYCVPLGNTKAVKRC